MNILEIIEDLIPKKVDLVYVDYQDSLDNHKELIQQCLRKGSKDLLYEKIDEWFDDARWEGMLEIKKQLRSDLEKPYPDGDIDEVMELYEQEIEDIIYSRDESTPVKDILRNTSDIVCFADTGIEIEESVFNPVLARANRMLIKKTLGIKDSSMDIDIDMMIAQAGYGGELRIYFTADVEDLLDCAEINGSVEFDGTLNVAIANSGNGSGDHCEINGKFTASIKSVYVDSEVKYSYTYDVCGMSSDWCANTYHKFSDTKVDKVESELDSKIETEQKYQETFQKGGCTFGDMNINRHRGVYYINHFPCGSRCPVCGTFWID